MTNIAAIKRLKAERALAAIAAGKKPAASDAAQIDYYKGLMARSPQLQKDSQKQIDIKTQEILFGNKIVGGSKSSTNAAGITTVTRTGYGAPTSQQSNVSQAVPDNFYYNPITKTYSTQQIPGQTAVTKEAALQNKNNPPREMLSQQQQTQTNVNTNVQPSVTKTLTGNTMTEYKPDTIKKTPRQSITSAEDYLKKEQLKKDNPVQKVLDKSIFGQDTLAGKIKDKTSSPFINEMILPAGIFATKTVLTAVAHPVQTVKGIFTSILHPVKTVQEVQNQFSTLSQTKGETYALSALAGTGAGMYATGKIVEAGFKYSPIKVEVEKINVPVKGGGDIVYNQVGVRVGSYGKTIAGTTKVTPAVQDLSTGVYLTAEQSKSVPYTQPYTNNFIGKPNLNQPIAFSDLAKSMPMPLTASGTKGLLYGIIETTKAEKARVQSNVNIAYLYGKEKGLPVPEFKVNIEGIKDAAGTTKVVEKLVNQDGAIFGSLTTKQLPNKPVTLNYLDYTEAGKKVTLNTLQNVKQGDVDVMFKGLTVEQIKPKIAEATTQLQTLGEDVRVSPTGKGTIIEFTPKPGTTQGSKFLEAKSGINQEAAGLGDSVPAGYAGIKFPNFKAGQAPKSTAFGDTQAIYAGEQLQRKGAGSLILSEGAAGETSSFSQPGILGRQGSNPRGLKDTAGFVQSGIGITEIRSSSLNPYKRLTAEIGKSELNRNLKSYTPEQQFDIITKVKETTGTQPEVITYPFKESTPAFSKAPVFTAVNTNQQSRAELKENEFYHGTSKKAVSPILKEGLKQGDVGWTKAVFLTKDIEIAKTYGGGTEDISPAILKVKLTESQINKVGFSTKDVIENSEYILQENIKPSQIEIIKSKTTSPSIATPVYTSPSTLTTSARPNYIPHSSTIVLAPNKIEIVKSPYMESPSSSPKPSVFSSVIPKIPKSPSSPSSNSPKSPGSGSSGGSSPSSPFSPPSPSPVPPSPSPTPVSPISPGSPGGKSPGSPFGKPGKPFTPSPPPIYRGLKESKKGEKFETLVRSKGMFKIIATSENVQDAFTAGRTKVQNTAAASFRVRAVNNAGGLSSAGKQFLPSNSFYESKKEPGTFIQKRANRINTPGEKREITFKGIFASKQKKGIFGRF